MSYRFHAAAPPGEWINDPNALFHAGGRYHLYVQHAADAPEFKRIGWGHLSSSDLQDWRWEGVAVSPDERASIYSGSIAMADPPLLFFTRHERDGPWQTQRRAAATPDFRRAVELPGEVGPAGRNARDPFVFRGPNGWRMLVAKPCDWTGWRGEPPSSLELWTSPDLDGWELSAAIGPWSPPGVMWEVPALIDFGEAQALILSLVDRRGDTATCEVRYWLGRLTDGGFARAPGFPAEGAPVDHGPDFYAAIPNAPEGWPTPGRVVVGWASSWSTARLMPWPEGRGGGPISMPRRVELLGDRLAFGPGVERAPDRVFRFAAGSRISLARDGATLEVAAGTDRLTVRRRAAGLPDFDRAALVGDAGRAELSLYADGSVIEMFWRGVAITAVLPGRNQVRIART